MRKMVIAYNEEDDKYNILLKLIMDAFSGRGIETERLCFKSDASKNQYRFFLWDTSADYICTLDMAGFGLDTLMETSIYNILTAKQLHIIVDKEKLDFYRNREFALNLFFMVPEAGDAGEWKKEYPFILNIDGYPPFETMEGNIIPDSEFNREIVKSMINEFFRKVGEN